MAKSAIKKSVELLLVSAELTGLPERRLLLSRNLGSVDLVWPRNGVARKSAAREMRFRKGKADFTAEPWARRIVFREEIEGHCGLAVSITEPLSVQKLRKLAKLTAKLVLKEGADLVAAAMAGYGDIAAAPIDALATIVGESEAPKSIAQGVVDFTDLPGEGEERLVTIPLTRPQLFDQPCGSFTLLVKG